MTMDEEISTLIKDVENGRRLDADRRISLETFSTLREKRRVSRHHLDHRLRNLRRIVKKALRQQDITFPSQDEEIDIEPLQMGQRLVLRSGVRFPLRKLLDIHAIYKRDSAVATNLLRSTRHPHRGWYPFDRCATRAEFEEQQKVTSQMGRLIPADSGLTRQTQELCEEVSQAHGQTSDIETALLGEIGRVRSNVIEDWFKAKKDRLKAQRAALRLRRHLLLSARVKNFSKFHKASCKKTHVKTHRSSAKNASSD